jgi:hypothetical protein
MWHFPLTAIFYQGGKKKTTLKSTMKFLEGAPWFAIIGVILVMNLALSFLGGNIAALWTALPTLIAAMLYLTLGYLLQAGKYKESFKVFLMAGIFAISTLLLWSKIAYEALEPSMWILFIAQLLLAGMILAKYKIPIFSGSGTWMYAAVFVILTASIGGAWVNIAAVPVAVQQLQQGLWAIAVASTSFGFIVRPANKEVSTGLYVIGTAVALIAAFALGIFY